jgi:hypothetical protein
LSREGSNEGRVNDMAGRRAEGCDPPLSPLKHALRQRRRIAAPGPLRQAGDDRRTPLAPAGDALDSAA